MVIVFDLDDTLFDSTEYVFSGFLAVANALSPLLKMPSEKIFQDLQIEYEKDRQYVFDRFLEKQGCKTQQLVKYCLSVYRKHDPKIHLFPEAMACLEHLKDYPVYIVTDGNKLVQKRKYLALGLSSQVLACYCTHAFGLQKAKPSPYCFQLICQRQKVDPSKVVYIGDNPYKDFVGLKPLGFHTIRVLTGPYKDVVLDLSHEAEVKIATLKDLNKEFFLSNDMN